MDQLLSLGFSKRFWSNVEIKGIDECWPWKKYIKNYGYGQTSIGGRYSPYRSLYSHRVAWIITMRRNIPDGLMVLHSCIGNRACCNPAHLYLGDQFDNMKDMHRQGRSRWAGLHLSA